MSFISGLSFDLVSASTKQPLFSKVDSEGTLWFCAEEGAEFFTSFQSFAPMPVKVWAVEVDGKSLKHAHRWKKEARKPYFMGVEDSDGAQLPLRFAALGEAGEGGEGAEQQGGKGGTISFKVSEYDPGSMKKRKNPAKAATFSSADVGMSTKDKKGGLKAEVGGRENAKVGSRRGHDFTTKTGALLAQFECRYMSEIGLVHKKIVVPGEVWDWEKEQEQAAAAEAAKPKPAKRARKTGAEAAPKRAKKEKK